MRQGEIGPRAHLDQPRGGAPELEYFGAVAVWYLVLTTVWAFVQAWIERKLAVSERGEELSFWERLVQAWTPVQAWARGAR